MAFLSCLAPFADAVAPIPSLGGRRRLRAPAQTREQWLEECRIGPPAPDGMAVDRLPNLRGAEGADRSLRLMKRKAAGVPREPAMRDDATRLTFEIADHVLVLHIEDATGRQHTVPMRHQLLITPIVPAQLRQIVGVILFFNEQF